MKSNDNLEGFANSVIQGSLISISSKDSLESEDVSEQEETEEISEEEFEDVSDLEENVELSEEESEDVFEHEESEEISETEIASENGDENETESEIVAYSSIDYSDRFSNLENSQYVIAA